MRKGGEGGATITIAGTTGTGTIAGATSGNFGRGVDDSRRASSEVCESNDYAGCMTMRAMTMKRQKLATMTSAWKISW